MNWAGLQKLAARVSLILILLVIVAGSVVRTTGSGMGCPDWPKCFGYLIPPTQSEEVRFTPGKTYPRGAAIIHQDALYTARTEFVADNEFNAADWAAFTRHDYAIFNPVHTWIEYLNRLLGALSGVPVLALFIFSLVRIRQAPVLALAATGVLVLLGLEAWLGKLVVDGNLIPQQITLHMMGAMLIVLLLGWINAKLSSAHSTLPPAVRLWGWLAVVLLLVQIYAGTQVREYVDLAIDQGVERANIIDSLPIIFKIHRSFSLVILGAIGWMLWQLYRQQRLRTIHKALAGVTLCEVVAGMALAYAALPGWLQPLHLVGSAAMLALLVYMLSISQGLNKTPAR